MRKLVCHIYFGLPNSDLEVFGYYIYKGIERESKLLGSCLHFPLCSFFFFFKDFLVFILKSLLNFKVFIEFVTILLLFYGLVFWP